MSKAIPPLQVIALIVFILASVSVGLNQFASFIERGNQDTVAYNEALAGCVKNGTPHFVFVEGKAYCYKEFRGSTIIAPLEELGDK